MPDTDPNLLQIIVPRATMRAEASYDAEPINELLYGDHLQCLSDNKGDFIHVKARLDGYEGYIEVSALGQVILPSHKIAVPQTHIYAEPDFKASPVQPLFLSSQIAATSESTNGFRKLSEGGWVFEDHLVSIDHEAPDFVETGLLFLHVPYLWGGRSVAGLDCSGLVQLCLNASGIACPRDTHQQIEALGQDAESPRRGDLVFFERHVGVMIDNKQLLNATSRHMKVVIEDLEAVAEAYGGILAIKRL